MNPEVVGPASLALSQTVGSFQFFMPRLSEVRRASALTDLDIVGDVRMGEVAGTAMCLGIGAMISFLTKSSIPVFVSAFVAVVLIGVYETALQSDRLYEPRTPVRSVSE